MENKWVFIYFLANEKLTLGMRYTRYLVINTRSHHISFYKCKIPSIKTNQWNYAMWHWKKTWEPLQISINRRPQPKGKRLDSRGYKFSLRLSLSLSLQARKLSLKEFSSLLHLRLKFNKNEALLDQAKTPHKSSSTTLWRQIKVFFKASNHNISLRNTRSNLHSCKAQILAWLLK